MVITKTLLTEILLEVTNEEILHVAKETHRKATRGLVLFFQLMHNSNLSQRNRIIFINQFKITLPLAL